MPARTPASDRTQDRCGDGDLGEGEVEGGICFRIPRRPLQSWQLEIDGRRRRVIRHFLSHSLSLATRKAGSTWDFPNQRAILYFNTLPTKVPGETYVSLTLEKLLGPAELFVFSLEEGLVEKQPGLEVGDEGEPSEDRHRGEDHQSHHVLVAPTQGLDGAPQAHSLHQRPQRLRYLLQ
ncbi:hypothetical protein B296_00017197 [Ensete ventricosum]|uniref:Uncharacterized protein n=1 Tax=Ensete ventricosum TaxID=4639 RepID=A0A427AFP6_ENSVE|nr:hypothetical protein B296_00017197 [Ensete ventricosum]